MDHAYLDAHLPPTTRPRDASFAINTHASSLVAAITARQGSFVVLGYVGAKLQFDLNVNGSGALYLPTRASDSFVLDYPSLCN
jgi:hypothetical protein